MKLTSTLSLVLIQAVALLPALIFAQDDQCISVCCDTDVPDRFRDIFDATGCIENTGGTNCDANFVGLCCQILSPTGDATGCSVDPDVPDVPGPAVPGLPDVPGVPA